MLLRLNTVYVRTKLILFVHLLYDIQHHVKTNSIHCWIATSITTRHHYWRNPTYLRISQCLGYTYSSLVIPLGPLLRRYFLFYTNRNFVYVLLWTAHSLLWELTLSHSLNCFSRNHSISITISLWCTPFRDSRWTTY